MDRLPVCPWIVGCYGDACRTAPLADRMNEEATVEFHALVERARGEFLEMPGLRLTIPQAARLWGLDTDSCVPHHRYAGRIVVPALDAGRQCARVDRGIL